MQVVKTDKRRFRALILAGRILRSKLKKDFVKETTDCIMRGLLPLSALRSALLSKQADRPRVLRTGVVSTQ